MFLKCSFIFVCYLCLSCEYVQAQEPYQSDGLGRNESRSRLLSRSKRFLVFPTGSSLQLVFCVQTAALIPIGDIFLYGNTAALAWNLPTDSKLLLMLNKYKKHPERKADGMTINYVDEDGKLLAKMPYNRRTIVNPAFAKRSVDDKTSFKRKVEIKLDRMKMHQKQAQREYLKKHHMDQDSIDFHRNNRIDLYEKIIPFITAIEAEFIKDSLYGVCRDFVASTCSRLGGDGRQCVLYKLCEAAKISEQGTFLQEILRVIFTLPKNSHIEHDYDKAHSSHDDCSSLYPECDIDTYS